MKSEKTSELFVKNLLHAMPAWNSKLVRPFKNSLNGEMSLETYYCLETLRSRETATMTEMAKRLNVPKQQATKLMDTLVAHGFVERTPRESDRRTVEVRLTQKAVSYLDDYYMKNKAFIRSLEEKLTEQELQKLNDAAVTLAQILPKLQ